LCFEHEPASVQDALCHFGFDQFLTAHVTDEYCHMTVYPRRAVLMQGIFASVLNFGVDCVYTGFFTCPLRLA